jgi:hypothetical protein
MQKDQDDPGARWPLRLRRWLGESRRTKGAFVILAVAMAIMLLVSYHEVLQDHVARAERTENVAHAGTVKPEAPPGAHAAGARTE